jgi:TRAP-type C4-dicarboxylate transport system permease small subunit
MTLALLGTLGIIAIVLHVSLDIVLRTTIRVSMPATLEMVTRYYMILLALMPLGWVEWKNRMISVEIVSDFFGATLKRWQDILIAVFSLLLYVAFTWATWDKAIDQYNIGAYVTTLNQRLPVWPTYFVLPLAFGLAAFVCTVRILQGVTGRTLNSAQD